MKITQKRIKEIIKEEMKKLNEMPQMTPATDFRKERDALQSMYHDMPPAMDELERALIDAIRQASKGGLSREEIYATMERAKSLGHYNPPADAASVEPPMQEAYTRTKKKRK